MTFPTPNTVYIWNMNETDYSYGVFDFMDDGESLDRLKSISEFQGDLESAIEEAVLNNPGFYPFVITAPGMLAAVDQYAAEIRNSVLG